MPRKPITAPAGMLAVLLILLRGATFAADTDTEVRPKFLGANSCASSGCHGGAGAHQNQNLTWTTRDFHFQRPYATLTTARSKQISAVLQIKDPTVDYQCISCHAPLREVPEPLRGAGLRITEGVSCETCHAPGEHWLRSHTRADYTHNDRVLAGMRDLKTLYVRANTCVACHQTVALPLLKAGHPELIFELDGQAVAEPKHWREKEPWHGAQAWAVGQSVALREMLWQLEKTESRDPKLIARTSALLWLFEKLNSITNDFPKTDLREGSLKEGKIRESKASADILARELSELKWSARHTLSVLQALSSVSANFKQPAAFPEQHARRAERLVLALDRIVDPQQTPEADAQLKNLFVLAQSIPDFNPTKFAAALETFARAVDRRIENSKR